MDKRYCEPAVLLVLLCDQIENRDRYSGKVSVNKDCKSPLAAKWDRIIG